MATRPSSASRAPLFPTDQRHLAVKKHFATNDLSASCASRCAMAAGLSEDRRGGRIADSSAKPSPAASPTPDPRLAASSSDQTEVRRGRRRAGARWNGPAQRSQRPESLLSLEQFPATYVGVLFDWASAGSSSTRSAAPCSRATHRSAHWIDKDAEGWIKTVKSVSGPCSAALCATAFCWPCGTRGC